MVKNTLFVLIFVFIGIFAPKQALAVTCSEGDLPNLSVFVPLSISRTESATIRIISAPEKFRSQTVYFSLYTLTDATPPFNKTTVTFPAPIQLDESGNGEINISIQDLAPTLTNGSYNFEITGVEYGPSCITPASYQVEVTGESGCIPATPGDLCDPNSTTPLCLNYQCTNGVVTVPPISTFSYRCVSNEPLVCAECEHFPNGEVVCGALSPQRPINCSKVCDEASTSTTSFQVSEGCIQGVGYVNTAIGCIPYDIVNRTAEFFIKWGIAVGGGAALLVMAVASFQFALSQGIPQKVESAKSLFMSSIGGLAFLLLSVFLLRFIGVDVLGLFS